MKKFPALHTISALFKILAWIVGIAALILGGITIGGLYSAAAFGSAGNVVAGILIILIGAFYVLMLYGIAESILVILAIEENTRKSKEG